MNNAHRCFECSSEFEWDFQLEYHYKSHRAFSDVLLEPEQHSCDQCLSWNSYSKLEAHEHYNLVHESQGLLNDSIKIVPRYACELCKLTTHTCLVYIKHHGPYCNGQLRLKSETKLHADGSKGSEKKTSAGNVCTHCSYQSDDVERFERHLLQHVIAATIEWFYCDKCSYKAIAEGNLREHKLQKHPATSASDGLLSCSKCSYRSGTKRNLDQHQKLCGTEGIKWFYCDKCSYRAKQKGHLKAHGRRHDAAPKRPAWFACHKCPYQTGHRKNLKRHMLQHVENVVWYECAQCSYRGKSSARFNRHVLRHTVSYSCAHCPYQSKKKSNFNSHMLEHATSENIVWYDCTVCSYRTKYKNNLKSHMLRHADPKDVEMHKCDKCSFQTKRKVALRNHLDKIH